MEKDTVDYKLKGMYYNHQFPLRKYILQISSPSPNKQVLSQGQSRQREQDASSCEFLFSGGFQAEASEPIGRSVNVE